LKIKKTIGHFKGLNTIKDKKNNRTVQGSKYYFKYFKNAQ